MKDNFKSSYLLFFLADRRFWVVQMAPDVPVPVAKQQICTRRRHNYLHAAWELRAWAEIQGQRQAWHIQVLMCAYINSGAHMYFHTGAHVCFHTGALINLYTGAHMYIYMYIYTGTYMYLYTYRCLYVLIYIQVLLCIYIQVCIYRYLHIQVQHVTSAHS